jgi:hypothetical protein
MPLSYETPDLVHLKQGTYVVVFVPIGPSSGPRILVHVYDYNLSPGITEKTRHTMLGS